MRNVHRIDAAVLQDLDGLLSQLDRALRQRTITVAEDADRLAADALEIRGLLVELRRPLQGAASEAMAATVTALIQRCDHLEGMAKEVRNDLLTRPDMRYR